MIKILGTSLICFGIYFIISLPYSMYQYNSRYADFNSGMCEIENSTIIPDDFLYQFSANFTINNCTQNIEVCCSNYNYWLTLMESNQTRCHYNQDCIIVPDFIENTNLGFFEISSFVTGVLFALNIIFYYEYKKIQNNSDYEVIN
jgi:hypothetical protein